MGPFPHTIEASNGYEHHSDVPDLQMSSLHVTCKDLFLTELAAVEWFLLRLWYVVYVCPLTSDASKIGL